MTSIKTLSAFAILFATSLVSGCDSGTSGGLVGTPGEKIRVESPPVKTSADVTIGKAPDPKAPAPAPVTPASPAGEPEGNKPKAGDEVAVMETTQGRIILQFFPKVAPGHVKNFTTLAKKGFYDGTKFHRVIPGFMIQGGDPNTKTGKGPAGTGGPGYSIKAEFSDMGHVRGILSMARSSDPDSAGSQFFIVVSDSHFLDHQYTVFGQVVEGMAVADKIVNLPKDARDNPTGEGSVIKSIKIEKWPLKK